MKDETILALAAMICGVAFGAFVIWLGIDSGVALSIVAGIFGVAGYNLKAWRDTRS